jgi:hypothetical protein
MCCENGKNEKLTERLLKLMDERDYLKDDLDTWTDALEELSEIEDAFKMNDKANEKPELHGKTILDVGTDAVKPLYIALKFKPKKIIGINDCFPPFVSNIELKSKIFRDTELRLFTCSLFNKVTLRIIQEMGEIDKFDFVLVSKTLHHLRTGTCIAKKRDEDHNCEKNETQRETESDCIYEFETRKIFDRLLELGTRVIIYESFDPNAKDDDKVRGRGAYFTREELTDVFSHLSNGYSVQFIRPEKFLLTQETVDKVEPMLREVDDICFYVEKREKRTK